MITGVTGSGKSSFCSFLCCDENAFASKAGFASETVNSAAAIVTLQDKNVKLIDTPGFCDVVEDTAEHVQKVGEGIYSARKGVNAVGLAISAGNRYSPNETVVIEEISQIKSMVDFTFILFTHADYLGDTDAEQAHELKNNLAAERCPAVLKDLMKQVKDRYVLVDSTNNTVEYHRAKVQEILEMIETVHIENDRRLYTNELFIKAKETQEKIIAEKIAILKKKKMAEFKKTFEAEAAKQAEIVAKEARIQERLAEQKKINMQKRMEGEEKQLQKQREEKLAEMEKEKQRLHEENEKVQEEVEQLKQKLTILKDDEAQKLQEQAHEETLEALTKEFNKIRLSNEELRKKGTKKWYNFLAKKSTGKECVIQ